MPAEQHAILRRMDVQVISLKGDGDPTELHAIAEGADLIIDALLGYSLVGDPRGIAAILIEWANTHGAPILALDNPSGLDVTSGRAGRPCVGAAATLTLALPKRNHHPHCVTSLTVSEFADGRRAQMMEGVRGTADFACRSVGRQRESASG